MAQVVRHVNGMRIIALPLTTRARSTGYTYYHFQTPPPAASTGKPSLVKRATGKAGDLWAGFGKTPEGSWKHKVYKYGQGLIDRVEFEELALKSIDPTLGPKVAKMGQSEVKLDEKVKPSIPLLHPTSFASTSSPLNHLKSLVSKRIPLHRKGFYTWMLISPLTAPFMIIPVIPNLPFFFCVWRSWSHYRAYKASTYLQSLLDQGAIVPDPNVGLDEIYAKYAVHPPPNPSEISEKATDDQERLLFRREAIPRIVNLFDLPSSATSDLYRAVDQTAVRLKKKENP